MAIQFLNGQNINGDVTITGNVLLGGSSLDPKEITIQQIGVTSTETTAIMHDGNGVLKTRTLGAGAFGPTPVGAYLPLAGGTLTGALAGTTATFSGLTTLETFPQTEPIRGEVYSIDPHKYISGVSYWTWTKIAQLDETGHASLKYNCKADVNYPHVAVGWVTISSYNSASISISHQQIIPSETIQPQIWLDNNRDVWIRMVNASWVTNFQYNWEVVDPNVATIYDGTTQSNTQPANSTVIEVGQEIKFPYTNAAAPVASTTYIPQTITGNILARNGNITLGGTGRIQGVDTVSAATDAANKAYVDAHDGGAGVYLPLAGGTMDSGATINMSGTLTIDGSSSVKMLVKGGARIALENANATDSFYIANTGGNLASVLDLGSTLTIAENGGASTFAGKVALGGTGQYTTNQSLNIDGTGLAIKNNVNGSSNNWSYIHNTATASSSNLVFATGAALTALTLAHSGAATFAGDLTVSGGDITLGGTGRIQGIDTVSATTDAANKAYVDAHTSGVQTVTTGNANTITIGGTAADPTVAANTGTVSSSSDNLATGAQIQTAIDTATTGALKFVSEWDASGLNGGSPDLRLAATHIPGSYYIVSAAGASTPNGSGTTPNSWSVGDWCVRADLATDTWQKIDNTQVGNITGTGVFDEVAIFNNNSNITSSSALKFEALGMASKKLSVDGSVFIDAGYLSVSTIDNATTDTDKFLVSDSGVVKYRTGAEVRSDIGAGTGSGNVTTGGFTSGRVPFANSSVNLDNSANFSWDDSDKKLNVRAKATTLANQPAIPMLIDNAGGVDGRVMLQIKTNDVSTASAQGAGITLTAPQNTTGTYDAVNSLIFLQTKSPNNQTIHSAPKNIKFYVDNHDTNAGSGTDYNAFGDLALEIFESKIVKVYDELQIGSISNASSDTDKFLVSNSGVVEYRTGAQVLSDIGAGTGSGTVTGSGTAKNLTMWATGGTGIEDSPIKTATVNTLNQITVTNGERLIIDKPSSVTSGDPAFQIAQDGNAKVEFGWDDDGGGFGFMYNYSGNGLKLGAAGNNPMIEVVTTSGSESVNLHKQLELKDYGSGTYTGTSAYYLIADSSGNVIEKTPAQVRSDIGAGTGSGSMSSWIIDSDSGSGTILNGATMKIAGGTNITTSESGGVVTANFVNNSGYITSSSVGNATISLQAGTGLTGGGSFTTNQNSNQTIIFNASGGGTIGGSGTATFIPMFTAGTTLGNSAMSQANIGTGSAKRITVTGARMTIIANGGDADGGTLNLSSNSARLGIATDSYPGAITEPEASLDVGKNARIRGSLNVGSTNEQYLFVSTTGDTPVGYVKMSYYGQGTDYDLSGDASTSVQYTTGFSNGGKISEDERIMTFKLTRSQIAGLLATQKTLIPQDSNFNYIVKEAYMYQVNQSSGQAASFNSGNIVIQYQSSTGGTTRIDNAFTLSSTLLNATRSNRKVLFFKQEECAQVGSQYAVPRAAVVLKATSSPSNVGSGTVDYYLRLRVKNIDFNDDIKNNSQLITVT